MERSLASFRFARRVSRRAARPLRAPGQIAGVAADFEILEHGERADFRTLIDEIVGGEDRRWRPGDPYARYLPSGALVTCIEENARLSTAPVPMQPGIATVVADELLARRGELAGLLRRFGESAQRSPELRGFGLHVSVFVPSDRAPQVAARMARTVAPALMLLLELGASPGASIRAAGRRVAMSGEHLGDRDDLRVLVTFAIAAAIAAERGIPLPSLAGEVADEPGRGWFVDRTAFGEDVYVEGRMASLRLDGGGEILAGTLLGDVWSAARSLAEAHATPEELALVDDTVSGARALPLERDPSEDAGVVPLAPVQEFATILRERRRDEIVVRPAAVDWDAATMQVSTPSRTFYARVPVEGYAAFATLFERGSLDGLLRAFGASEPRGRFAPLTSAETGLYDVAEVPSPEAGNQPVRAGVEAPLETPAKQRRPSTQVAMTTMRRAAAFGGAALMFVGTAAFAYIGLRQSEPRPAPTRESRAISSPRTSVLSEREGPSPSTSSLLPSPSSSGSGGASVVPPPPNPDRSRGDDPRPARSSDPTPSWRPYTPPPTQSSTPRPTQTATPAPTPTPTQSSTPRPTQTPTPTPTPTPTQSGTPVSSEPAINASTSCSIGTSHVSFTVRVPTGAPRVIQLLVKYSENTYSPSPSPAFPMTSYSGSASAPVTPTSNHKWYIAVKDESGRVTTRSFGEQPRCS